MEMVFLLIGLAAGVITGYFAAARKTAALNMQIQMQQTHAQDLLKAEEQKAGALMEQEKREKELLRMQLNEAVKELNGSRQREAALQTENRNLNEKLEQQKEEIANLHNQFKLEFENIANRIFQQKTESFSTR